MVYLNAGDNYQGTFFYTLFKHRVVSEFVNQMKFDAMSLGNHEFDDGVNGLAPFLKATESTPTVGCNVDVSKEPSLDSIRKSIVLERNGRKIGIIGYLTPDTRFLASVGRVQIDDEIKCIRKEANRLIADGVNILIGLGHSGLEKDIAIARAIPELDLIVGGHSHSFLSPTYGTNDPQLSTDTPVDKYPVVIKQDKSVTLVVQAYAFGKYLGVLDLQFDKQGLIKTWSGTPIFLNSTNKGMEVKEVSILICLIQIRYFNEASNCQFNFRSRPKNSHCLRRDESSFKWHMP